MPLVFLLVGVIGTLTQLVLINGGATPLAAYSLAAGTTSILFLVLMLSGLEISSKGRKDD